MVKDLHSDMPSAQKKPDQSTKDSSCQVTRDETQNPEHKRENNSDKSDNRTQNSANDPDREF